MPYPEHVTRGWSVTYPSSRSIRTTAVERQPGRFPAGRVYPSWCLEYPLPTSPPCAHPAADGSDPGERLLRQAFGS